jgi:hypothetical protein
MNIEIPSSMIKWKQEIEEAFGGPMFFIYDNELINMYSYLSRLSDSELQNVCRDDKYKKMCDTIIGERHSDYGDLKQFVNERGMLNIEGLLPILSSFPSFNEMMNFIMRIKPGFRYTQQFKELVEDNTKIEVVNQTTTYTLENYKYEKTISDNEILIRHFKFVNNKWLLHRINGPAYIRLYTEKMTTNGNGDIELALFETNFYKNDILDNNDIPSLHYFRESTDEVEGAIDTQTWYKNDRIHRDNGPARIKTYIKPCPNNSLRIDELCEEVSSKERHKVLTKRNNRTPRHRIISGEGDTIVEEYFKNGKPIKV